MGRFKQIFKNYVNEEYYENNYSMISEKYPNFIQQCKNKNIEFTENYVEFFYDISTSKLKKIEWFIKGIDDGSIKVKNAFISIKNNLLEWISGEWLSGTWKNGYWGSGIFKSGVWENGYWEGGKWENGIWKKGHIIIPKRGGMISYFNSKINPNDYYKSNI